MTRYGQPAPAANPHPSGRPPAPLVVAGFHQSSSLMFQLVLYAGPNTNSRKVTEYGGNTLGYGSRSVLGTGWPKDLVKVNKNLHKRNHM